MRQSRLLVRQSAVSFDGGDRQLVAEVVDTAIRAAAADVVHRADDEQQPLDSEENIPMEWKMELHGRYCYQQFLVVAVGHPRVAE